MDTIKNIFKTIIFLMLLISVVGIIAYLYFLYKSEEIEYVEFDSKSNNNVRSEKVAKKAAVVKEEIEEKVVKAVERVKEVVSERQQQIVDFLKEQDGWVKMNELKDYLSEVTPRTLRRDLQALVEKKLVEYQGSTKNRSYRNT